jgi:hypothetical protein
MLYDRSRSGSHECRCSRPVANANTGAPGRSRRSNAVQGILENDAVVRGHACFQRPLQVRFRMGLAEVDIIGRDAGREKSLNIELIEDALHFPSGGARHQHGRHSPRPERAEKRDRTGDLPIHEPVFVRREPGVQRSLLRAIEVGEQPLEGVGDGSAMYVRDQLLWREDAGPVGRHLTLPERVNRCVGVHDHPIHVKEHGAERVLWLRAESKRHQLTASSSEWETSPGRAPIALFCSTYIIIPYERAAGARAARFPASINGRTLSHSGLEYLVASPVLPLQIGPAKSGLPFWPGVTPRTME